VNGEARFDVHAVRAQFPALQQDVHGKPLVWLDSAATTQKPQVVIDAMTRFYEHDNANVHRGVHALSVRATDAFEGAREAIRTFLGAASVREIVFTRGTTEAINLVANSFGASLRAGDEVLLSGMEHHSDIVPWQLLAQRTGVVVRPIPILQDGSLDLEAYHAMLSERTKLVGVVHVSNALGTVNPIRQMADAAHRVGARILVDGAQALAHVPVDVRGLDVDFYVCSAHKVYGPTGIGALYGKLELLESMPPWQGGGDMIRSVSFGKTTFAPPPARFEAGTPSVADAVGFGAALRWLSAFDLAEVHAAEASLLRMGTAVLSDVPGLRLIGTAPGKVAVLSFVIEGVHPHDLGTIVDVEGVAIRTGHHCAQPVMQYYGVPATARASLAIYNTEDDLHRLVAALHKAIQVMR
jgi:cysteine desulfurase/selenocysteine lyase